MSTTPNKADLATAEALVTSGEFNSAAEGDGRTPLLQAIAHALAEQRRRFVADEHAPSCYWNRARPEVDGDEAACCDCGLVELRQHAKQPTPTSPVFSVSGPEGKR